MSSLAPIATSYSRANPSFSSAHSQSKEKTRSYFFEFGKATITREEVKQWYQLLQRDQLPTGFVSIAYMKDQGTGFEHEFLLIYLLSTSKDTPTNKDTSDDYSYVCRIERMSNGFRYQALTEGDCAHDTVQIFSKDDYTELELSYSHPVRRVLNIRFQQRLDLLRVLELCYSMHKNGIAAKYTLLRFNCYFMCWMILINIIRGIDKWERRLGEDAWAKIVTQQLPQSIGTWIAQDPETPPPIPHPRTKVKHQYTIRVPIHSVAQYLCFRALAVLLGSESHGAVKMITDSIQSELGSARDRLLGAINNFNPNTLFPSDTQLYETIRHALSDHLNNAASKVLRQDKYAGETLWTLLSHDSPHGSSTNVLPPKLEASAAKKLHKMWFEYMWAYLDNERFRSSLRGEASTGSPSQVNEYSEIIPLVPQLLRNWKESYQHAVVEILGSCPNGYLNLCLFLHAG
ncbi:unnamed protein product [Rhizoctonia solani]|uniref:Uncharacterized protein n=1 Tax=Rhizoctonia solani TaxID=456999 RepID=A0A8H3H4N6_9AGAM|nr:unnamed protein product [Rhizoctonia solani]